MLPKKYQVEVKALVEQGKLDEALGRIVEIAEETKKIPEKKEISINGKNLAEMREDLKAIGVDVEGLPDKKIVELSLGKIEPLKEDIQEVKNTIETEIPEEKWVTVGATEDGTSITVLASDLEKKIPAKKVVDVKVEADNVKIAKVKAEADTLQKAFEWNAKVDISQIEASADIIQSKIEWKAKLDIAEVEADASKLIAITETIGESFNSVTSGIGGMFSDLAGMSGGVHFYEMIDILEDQVAIQEDLAAAQIKVADAQVKALSAKTKQIESGDAMIKVSGDGLQPHLEAFMWEILSAIQVQVNASASEYLVGV